LLEQRLNILNIMKGLGVSTPQFSNYQPAVTVRQHHVEEDEITGVRRGQVKAVFSR